MSTINPIGGAQVGGPLGGAQQVASGALEAFSSAFLQILGGGGGVAPAPSPTNTSAGEFDPSAEAAGQRFMNQVDKYATEYVNQSAQRDLNLTSTQIPNPNTN